MQGHDERRTSTDLSWAPVVSPESGYWQVKIWHVRIGDETLDMCETGECIAIVDTGSSLLGVPKQHLEQTHWKLARRVTDGRTQLDCRDFPGPTIQFDLGDFSIAVDAKDYSRPAALKVKDAKKESETIICRASLLPIDTQQTHASDMFILCESVLLNYYMSCDSAQRRNGFALARSPERREFSTRSVVGAPNPSTPVPSKVNV